jgi:hypothetical protein
LGLLRCTLRTLCLDFLFSLLLLKLLHLSSRVSVAARRLSSEPGDLRLARRIVGRRNRLALTLTGTLTLTRICRGPAIISQVQLLVFDSIRQLLHT